MKHMSRFFIAFGCILGIATTAQATPITGGQTQLTLTAASTFAMLGATISPLGTATLSSATNPVATFPITGGSAAPGGDVIQHMGSGLEISATSPTTIVDTRNYVINTTTEVIDASVSINGGSATTLALFKLGSKGLSNIPFTLTQTAVNDLNAAFGIDALSTSLQIGTMTSSPAVKLTPVPEPATAPLIGMALLGLAAFRRRARAAH